MPRVRSQLALLAPPEMLQRLRAAAAARGQTVTRLLLGWIEAGLAGDLPAPGAGGGAELLERLRALLVALQAQGASLRQMADALAAAGTTTRNGRPLSPSTVALQLQRLGLAAG